MLEPEKRREALIDAIRRAADKKRERLQALADAQFDDPYARLAAAFLGETLGPGDFAALGFRFIDTEQNRAQIRQLSGRIHRIEDPEVAALDLAPQLREFFDRIPTPSEPTGRVEATPSRPESRGTVFQAPRVLVRV